MAVFLKASSDCFSMTPFGKEFQSLIVRAIKLCRVFVCFSTNLNECLRVELPSVLLPFKVARLDFLEGIPPKFEH